MSHFIVTPMPSGKDRQQLIEFLNKYHVNFQVLSNIEELTRFMHSANGSTEIHSNKRPLPESEDRLASEGAGGVKRSAAGHDCEFQLQSIGVNPFKIQGTPFLHQTEAVGGGGSNLNFNSFLLEGEPRPLNAADLLEEEPNEEEENSLFSKKLAKAESDDDGLQKIESVEILVKEEDVTEDIGETVNLDDEDVAKNVEEIHQGALGLPPLLPSNSLKCNICSSTFRRYSLLKRHHVYAHPVCTECGIRFPTPKALSAHKPLHLPCDICGKHFPTRFELNRHKLIHTGEKRFKCEVCQKYFGQRSYLKVHMRIHTGEKPFKCHQCQKTFINTSGLYSHLRSAHGLPK